MTTPTNKAVDSYFTRGGCGLNNEPPQTRQGFIVSTPPTPGKVEVQQLFRGGGGPLLK